MAQSQTRVENLELIAGNLCLDFANTADWHDNERPDELLTSYPDLVAWSRHAGILSEERSARLVARAQGSAEAASAVLSRAITLREAIFRLFSAVIGGQSPDPRDLNTLNAEVSAALSRMRVTHELEGFGWDWAEEDALDQMLWPIAKSAADLLTSPEVSRVRKCLGFPCGWLFMDTTRNQSRRWCDMKSCGNRAKARRHYQRKREARRPPRDRPKPL